MILYLDASALVKRYVAEPGSDAVEREIAQADAVGTTIVTRVEVVAAFAKSVRVGTLTDKDADAARKRFHSEWSSFMRLHLNDFMAERAAALAWDHGLRGYDAVQLAAALTWREVIEESVSMMTYDRRLWATATTVGLTPLPDDLPALLESWKRG